MAVLYVPHFMQFFNDDGNPLSGGKLYTYAAGTVTPKATYTTAAGTTPNSNPITLDSAGRAVAFLSGSYKFRLQDSAGNLIKETDNVTAFSDQTGGVDDIIANFTEDVVTAADSIIFADVSDGNATKRDTVQGILDLVPTPTIPTVTSWANVTTNPTITNAGTITIQSWKWRRIGDTLYLRGGFVFGSTPASELRIGMPDGLTIDHTKIPIVNSNRGIVGTFGWSGNNTGALYLSTDGTNNYMCVSASNNASGFTAPLNSSVFGGTIYVDAAIPIVGW